MARRPGEVRREEILRATVEQIGTRGLASVRVADVATSMGVSTALIFYHFDTKERLVAEAFAYAAQQDLDRLDAALDTGGTPMERLATVLTLYSPTGKASSWNVWIEAWGAALSEPEIRATWKRLDQRWKDAVSAVLADGVASGDFACEDPEAAAFRLSAMMDGLAVQAVVNPTPLGRGTLQEWVRRTAALELGIDQSRLDPA